jgi:hypothetical protein
MRCFELVMVSTFGIFGLCTLAKNLFRSRDALDPTGNIYIALTTQGTDRSSTNQLLAKFLQPAVGDLMPQLLEIYIDAGVLPELGVALIRNLQTMMSPTISDYTANEWLKLWQTLAKPHPELNSALKMVAAGVKYKQNPQDKRIFLALPQELRPLLREALGIDRND